jgi:hypothetical protein
MRYPNILSCYGVSYLVGVTLKGKTYDKAARLQGCKAIASGEKATPAAKPHRKTAAAGIAVQPLRVLHIAHVQHSASEKQPGRAGHGNNKEGMAEYLAGASLYYKDVSISSINDSDTHPIANIYYHTSELPATILVPLYTCLRPQPHLSRHQVISLSPHISNSTRHHQISLRKVSAYRSL